MDAIETAIRNAFEKGDALDPDYRQRVYRSAVAAMEKALQANSGLTPEAAERRREAVRATIGEIESEFFPAARAEPSEPDDASADAVIATAASSIPAEAVTPDAGFSPPVVEPDTRTAPRTGYPELRIEPDGARAVRSDTNAIGGIEDRRPGMRESGRAMRLLPIIVIVLAAAAAVWWAASSGLFGAAETPERRSENPAEAVAPTAGSQEQADRPLLPSTETPRDWITVFSPADPTRVTAPAAASAEVVQDDSGRFMRIRSGTDGAPVTFGIGQGVLERIAGRRAVFNIVARAEEGMPTEMAVECDFGGLGDCGRKRYAVNYQRGDFLFEVEMPEGDPAAGAISIAPDVENAGKAIDVYEIRVAVD